LALFGEPRRWCREVDAVDSQGQSVHYDDENAVAWDVVGGMCHVFGWQRACELFALVSRHLVGPHSSHTFSRTDMVAMDALQEFNDHADTTFDLVVTKLRQLPIWLPSSSAAVPL